MIPRLIHRVWLGSEVPAEHEGPWRAWAHMFPDYTLRTWRDDDVRALGMPAEYDAARTYAERSDLARLRILNRHGGIYADCDLEPLRRFDDLWQPTDRLVLFEQAPGELMNGCMAAAPGSLGFIERLVLRNLHRHPADAAPVVRTGPFALNGAVRYEATRRSGGIVVLPCEMVDFDGTRLGENVTARGGSEAVIRTRLRHPPTWALTPDSTPPRRRIALNAAADLEVLPLRVRRRVSRFRSCRRAGRARCGRAH